MMAATAAGYADAVRNGGVSGQDAEEVAIAMGLAFSNTLMSKTYLQGASDFINMVATGDMAQGERWASRMAGSTMPSIAAWATRINDPYMKHVAGIVDGFLARTPGLSNNVEDRLDRWGRKIPLDSGFDWTIPLTDNNLGKFYDALIPFQSSSTEKAEPADLEFIQLGYYPGDPQVTLKGSEDDRTLRVNLRNAPKIVNALKIASGGTAASELLEDVKPALMTKGNLSQGLASTLDATGKRLKAFGGRTQLELLNELVTGRIEGAELKRMLKETTADDVDDYVSATQDQKIDILQTIISTYNRAANLKIKKDFPEVQEIRDSIPARTGSAYAPLSPPAIMPKQ
jgi:hypothetical protein